MEGFQDSLFDKLINASLVYCLVYDNKVVWKCMEVVLISKSQRNGTLGAVIYWPINKAFLYW